MPKSSKPTKKRYDVIFVKPESRTLALADELADLMTARMGVTVRRPDAVHIAIEAAVAKEKRRGAAPSER